MDDGYHTAEAENWEIVESKQDDGHTRFFSQRVNHLSSHARTWVLYSSGIGLVISLKRSSVRFKQTTICWRLSFRRGIRGIGQDEWWWPIDGQGNGKGCQCFLGPVIMERIEGCKLKKGNKRGKKQELERWWWRNERNVGNPFVYVTYGYAYCTGHHL